MVREWPGGVRLESDAHIHRRVDASDGAIRYGPEVNWFDRQFERVRSMSPRVADLLTAAVAILVCVSTILGQDIHESSGALEAGYHERSWWMVVTILAVCVPIAVRRRWPLTALIVSGTGILVHVLVGWPEGALPLSVLYLTYTVAAWSTTPRAIAGLMVTFAMVITLGLAGSPGLDAVGVVGVLGQFTAGWAVGVAMRHRRAAVVARVHELEERAEAEQQAAARVVAEERLRIARELHDVVAHSMSVIAVQAGVGAHVLDERPDQARAALDAISHTSRSTLTELRRLLGVLRDNDGTRSSAPAPGLGDLQQLVDDVRAAGVPVSLHVDGESPQVHPGMELSAYRVVQEALTNVIKHAGNTTRVDVHVHHRPGSLMVQVVDDGRGLAATPRDGRVEPPGHGLLGMRERVELWGGELSVGPAPGGGYRVAATLPYGDPE